ncbi:Dynein associated protein [Penicillium cf. griseofulvum]|uniref:Dynein associated protein n=1 Tax=Penicillium cf. griseofulvum TaxID=2972120 RepID=A0A9W9J3N9_9EURO|nr:Dynein associated protein [Penicillium cf. griseofulvum]
MSGQALSVGTVIELPDGRQATVRFIGTTHFADGQWIGLELDEATGKNDGAVQGERYFDCDPGYGMFVRPTVVGKIVQPQPESKQHTKPATSVAASKVQHKPGLSAGMRKQTGLPPTSARRQSTNAASTPTPAPKSVAARSSLRSPTKSPTKQLATTASQATRPPIGSTSRTSTVAPNRPRLAPSTRSSLGPSPTQSAASRGSRPSVSGPAARTSRPGSQSTVASSTAGLAKRPPLRQVSNTKASDGGDMGTSGRSGDPTDTESPDTEGESAQDGVIAPKASRQSMTATRPAASRSGAPLSASQRQAQSSAVNHELEELNAKLKVMEKKRADDKEKLKTLEQLQAERDKFETIIQKLQAKYQPQQLEVTELRKKLKELETRSDDVERMQAEHESLMEMATLDREMAEETAEAFKHECSALRSKLDELNLEVEVLREENEEYSQEITPEDRTTHGWLQMEKTNERLREALIRLRDMTQQQEADLRAQIKELEEDLEEYAAVKSNYEAAKERILVAEANVDDLKQQLETALGAEEMIEELADKNMRYQDEINELKAAIEDLESLKEISDEMEYTHIETEKQLQEELEYREGLFSDQCRKITQQDEVIEDLEYTLTRFRDLVTNLQCDLDDMRTTKQISEAETTESAMRHRQMQDLNMKLQANQSKALTKSIDLELNRMESEENAQHLSMIKLYLPEYFETERNSIQALLRFKRVGFKANVMSSTLQEKGSEHSVVSSEELFQAHVVLEYLMWISNVCDRFVNYITACSPEEFGSIKVALFEMEPVERMLNFWIEPMKKDEVNLAKLAVELQRSMALLAHLSETLLPSNLEMFADELCMRAHLSQLYIEHSAGAISRVKLIISSKMVAAAEGDEENLLALNKLDAFTPQARGYKVAMGKVSRSLDDLRSRSLALPKEADEPFKKIENETRQLSELARKLGENLVILTSDEGRTEPFSPAEILDCMSQAVVSFASSSETSDKSNDPVSLLFTRLREVGDQFEALDSISSDLSHTTEFERAAFPWVARAAELKSNKMTSPDADEEIRQLRNEIHEASAALGVKDNTIEEQGLKIEHLESRMREANKKAAMVKDLEAKIEEIQTAGSELEKIVEQQKKELQIAEAERDEVMARLERMKRMSGTAGLTATGNSAVIASEASLAAMDENESLRAEVESLQAAVRFLREENRRSNILDPYSVQRSTDMHAWLDAPLTRAKPTPEQEKIQRTALESRDVMTHLLKLTKESRVTDLKSTMAAPASDNNDNTGRTAWRPSKTRLRYQVLQQRENFEHWAEWRDEIVNHEREQDRLVAAKQERAMRDRVSRHAHKASVEFPQGLGHGMMGRAWQILGMQKHRKTGSISTPAPNGVEIVTTD